MSNRLSDKLRSIRSDAEAGDVRHIVEELDEAIIMAEALDLYENDIPVPPFSPTDQLGVMIDSRGRYYYSADWLGEEGDTN